MSTPPTCAQDARHPRLIANPPGRAAVDYRIGDFSSFRRALLVPRKDEHALAGWHPVAGTDLALQLVEWWAYLADVLTFYNERAIQEVLLRTAAHPEDIRRIVRLLGYRPRPGIGATGVVAALTDAVDPFVVPRGFAIEGGTGRGQPPQIFEVDDDIEIGRLGRPLPRSARFPVFRPSGPAAPPESGNTIVTPDPSRSPVARDLKRRLRNRVDAKDVPPDDPVPRAGETFPVFLDGVVAAVQPDDMLLIVKKDWLGAMLDPAGYAVTTVRSIEARFDTAEPPRTGLQMLAAQDLPAPIAECLILRPTKLAHLWLYHQRYPGSADPGKIAGGIAAQVVKTVFDPLGLFHGGGIPTQPPEDPRVLTGITTMGAPPPHGVAHLEAITRGIAAGDLVLFEKRTGGGILGMFEKLVDGSVPSDALEVLRLLVMQLVKVTGYAEDIWYANAPEMDRVGMGPPVGPPGHGVITGGEGPIPIPHSRITFDPNPFLDLMAMGDHDLDKIVVHYGWEAVGEQIEPPSGTRRQEAVEIESLPDVPTTRPVPVIVTDQNGKGEYGWLGQTIDTRATSTGVQLVPPLQALINLLPVSRGQTVRGEVLGSGDPTRVWQEFTLKRSPLTYLADTGPYATNGYRSTLRVRVDGIEWREVPSFYGQPPDARVFVTREDDANKTHVRFGDGENGARLPAGTVVADYRQGSGAAIPPAGTLTSILRPQPGLVSIVDAIPVGGGSDPDPPEQLRHYAPRSVLTFGRAISGDDYEVVAAQTPGVNRARVYWSWDPGSQRTVVKVFVGDDAAAVAGVQEALAAFGDPNRPVAVALAAPVFPDVTLRVQADPAYAADAVTAEVFRRLLDPQQLPFGAGVIRIGEPIYDSEIYDACLSVPGVVAVHGLQFGTWTQVPRVGGGGGGAAPRRLTLEGQDGLLGPGFIPDDVYDPLALANRIGTTEEALFDPFALATHLATTSPAVVPDAPAPAAPAFDEVVQIESTERHSPGEGRFYLLREERLHISAETARHVL